MKKILLSICAILALLSTVSVQADENEKTIKTIETSKLRGVKASNGFDVTIKQGSLSGAVISVDSRLQPYLIAEVRDGILVLGFDNIPRGFQNKLWTSKLLRKADVTVSSLEHLQASSSADIIGVGEFSTSNDCYIKVSSSGDIKDINLTAIKLQVKASSSGDARLNATADQIGVQASSSADVTINGTTDKLVVNTSSSSEANLVGLKAKDVSADASSSSDIKCYVLDKIRAHASSSADIEYHISKKTPIANVETSASSSGNCKIVTF